MEEQEEPKSHSGWSHYMVPGPNDAKAHQEAHPIEGEKEGVAEALAGAEHRHEGGNPASAPPMVIRTARRVQGSYSASKFEGLPDNYYNGNKHESELDAGGEHDKLRAWSVIVAGGLAGVLIVMIGLLLLQMQRRSQEIGATTAQTSKQASVVEGSSSKGSADLASALPPQPITGHYPPDFTLSTLEGKPVKLNDLRGKPVWVNFWATWCPPCRAEMPEMKQKYAQLKDKGLVILGVDMSEDPATVRQFTEGNGYDWTFLLDPGGQAASQYYVSGIPTHLFIGRDGIIKAVQVGGIPASMMDRYLSQIMDQ